jgi:hypothetical protein
MDAAEKYFQLEKYLTPAGRGFPPRFASAPAGLTL